MCLVHVYFEYILLTTVCRVVWRIFFFIKPTPSKIFRSFLLRNYWKGWVGRYLIKISVAPLEPFSISAASGGELMTFASIYTTPTVLFLI